MTYFKTFIIYHQVKPGVDCPDGIAAAWVAKKKYPDAELIGFTYDQVDSWFEKIPASKGDDIVIVDFSFPGSIIRQWLDHGVSVELIDHHVTAMNDLKDFANSIKNGTPGHYIQEFDLEECGATLAWKKFFPDVEMPYWLHHIRDRDLWNFELPDTPYVHEALSQLRSQIKDREILFRFFDGLSTLDQYELHDFLYYIGNPALEAKAKKVDEIASRMDFELFNPGDFIIPVVRLNPDGTEDRYVSDVCSKLYKAHPNAHFVACVTSDGTWSLRSDKDGNNTDVGAIAKALGGGGHRNAAGFKPKEA